MVRPGVLAVDQDRCQRRALGDRCGLGHVRPPHVGAEGMAGGEYAERLSVARVDRRRLFEQGLRDQIILPRHTPVVRQRPHHQIPGVQAIGRFAPGMEVLRRVELRFDGGYDGFGNLVLYREQIGKAAVIALRPDVAAGGSVVELHGDTHAVAGLAHAAFDHIANAEVSGDLLHMDGLAFVDERRVPRDHEEPAQFGERGNDILADTVGKILLLRIAAHVGKGKYGDGGPVGQRQARPRRLVDFIRWIDGRLAAVRLRSHGADKAEALARDRTDELLALAAVSDRLTRGVNAAGQRRFRHDSTAPDRSDEVVLTDDMVAVLHQIYQQIEYLGLDRYRLLGPAELAGGGGQRVIIKKKIHRRPQP